MKRYKIKKFTNEAKKHQLTDYVLNETLKDFLELETKDQQKFSLGASLYKLRIATKEGRGKSGGSRSILAFKKENKLIWLHLFSKNDKGNVSAEELKKLKILSNILLDLSDSELAKLINSGELFEVNEHV